MANTKETVEATPMPKSKRVFSAVYEYLFELLILSLCAVFILFTFVFRLCGVDGESMMPTFKDGEIILVSDVLYTPTQYDVVVIHETSDSVARLNEPLIKRVIAVGGDRIRIDYTDAAYYDKTGKKYIDHRKAKVYVNDVLADSDFVSDTQQSIGELFSLVQEYEVPEGYVFVMGDNRGNSMDSRSAEIGMIDERRILGRVFLRVSPFTYFQKN